MLLARPGGGKAEGRQCVRSGQFWKELPIKSTTATANENPNIKPFVKNGRGGGIRTPDPLLPKQMRYQAALRPDTLRL